MYHFLKKKFQPQIQKFTLILDNHAKIILNELIMN